MIAHEASSIAELRRDAQQQFVSLSFESKLFDSDCASCVARMMPHICSIIQRYFVEVWRKKCG
ncbi:hypothetical protein [Bradyrhizobium sp. C9]|uniref:hypothetical protein n=1 Tax=Bradyrhizobium sp. C9 TaxID=142585 RepID=UPI0011779505|nr:hypothetical protein [Bradyrhizobium sp. C9]